MNATRRDNLQQIRREIHHAELAPWLPVNRSRLLILQAAARDLQRTERSGAMGPCETKRDQKWEYSFTVWPDETWKHPRSLFALFKMYGMLQLDFTEPEFERFRAELSNAGFTLRELSKRPFIDFAPYF